MITLGYPKNSPERPDRIEFRLDKRQMQLRDFAEQFDFTFYPMTVPCHGKI
jgi:hypothetical protein